VTQLSTSFVNDGAILTLEFRDMNNAVLDSASFDKADFAGNDPSPSLTDRRWLASSSF
jgi:hypothetical protein